MRDHSIKLKTQCQKALFNKSYGQIVMMVTAVNGLKSTAALVGKRRLFQDSNSVAADVCDSTKIKKQLFLYHLHSI